MDVPESIQKIIPKLDIGIDKVEKSSTGVYNLIGKRNDWIGFKDLRTLAAIRNVLKISSDNSQVVISVEE